MGLAREARERPFGRLPLEVPAAECDETHPVRFEFAANFTEFSLSDFPVHPLSSSPGQFPTPGPLQIRTRRFPPSGSSADAARGYGPQIRTVIRGRGSGKLTRSKSTNRSQVRRLRWLRRQSHLYQARLAASTSNSRAAEVAADAEVVEVASYASRECRVLGLDRMVSMATTPIVDGLNRPSQAHTAESCRTSPNVPSGNAPSRA